MRTGQPKTVELEYLESFGGNSVLDAGRFEVDGPLSCSLSLRERVRGDQPSFGPSGLDNGFPLADIKERMRPIYGQTDPCRSQLWGNRDAILPFA